MSTSAQKNWLTAVILGTLIVAIGSFLPWIVLEGGLSTGVNAFASSANLGFSSPNWLVLAACVLVATYAVLQYKGIAERTSKVPIVLLSLALLQTTLLLGASLFSTPSATQDWHVEGVPDAELSQTISQMFPPTRPMTAHPGVGMVIVFATVIWLLVAAVRYMRQMKETAEPSPAGAAEAVQVSAPIP